MGAVTMVWNYITHFRTWPSDYFLHIIWYKCIYFLDQKKLTDIALDLGLVISDTFFESYR